MSELTRGEIELIRKSARVGDPVIDSITENLCDMALRTHDAEANRQMDAEAIERWRNRATAAEQRIQEMKRDAAHCNLQYSRMADAVGVPSYSAVENIIEAAKALRQREHDAESRADALQQQAQMHAQESRTAHATIAEIYQLCTGSTGEPGNWNGAEPVRRLLARAEQAEAENARLREVLASISTRLFAQFVSSNNGAADTVLKECHDMAHNAILATPSDEQPKPEQAQDELVREAQERGEYGDVALADLDALVDAATDMRKAFPDTQAAELADNVRRHLTGSAVPEPLADILRQMVKLHQEKGTVLTVHMNEVAILLDKINAAPHGGK